MKFPIEENTGMVSERFNYSSFGQTETIGEASGNPFQYTGRENDGTTGLYYYRARYYSPEMGRFISEDPIGLMGGVNYFSYVGNSPCNFSDPLGLWYLDLNISIGLPIGLGGTGGLIIDTVTWEIRTYVGGGVISPGVSGSVTGSNSNPESGWTVGVQGMVGIAGQVGRNIETDNRFGELGGGLGWPMVGGSATVFYVSEPLNPVTVNPINQVELAICH